jgi:MFS family permease
MVSTFALFSSFYFLMPVLPLYVSGPLGGDQRTIGLVSSLFTVTAVTFRPFGGYLLDRYGRRGLHLAALTAFAVVVAGYAAAGTLAALLAVRLAHGLPWGAGNTAANTTAADLVPVSRRGEGIGLFGMAQTLAMAVAPAAAIAILGDGRFKTLFLCAAALAGAALAFAVPVRHPQLANPSAKLKLSTLVEWRVGWIAGALLFLTAGYGSVTTFVVVYAKELGVIGSGLFFTLLAIGLIAARLVAGRMFDRYGPGRVIGTGLALMASCYVLLFVGKAAFFAAAVMLGLGFGTAVPSFQAMAPAMVPAARRGAAFATVLASFDVGIGLGAYLLGHVAKALGYGPMYLVAGSLLLGTAWILVTRVVPAYAALRAAGGSAELAGPAAGQVVAGK